MSSIQLALLVTRDPEPDLLPSNGRISQFTEKYYLLSWQPEHGVVRVALRPDVLKPGMVAGRPYFLPVLLTRRFEEALNGARTPTKGAA